MEYDSYTGEVHSRITSPTCEDLGIPRDVTYEYLGTVEGLRAKADLMGVPISAATASNMAAHGLTAQSLVLHDLKYDPENPNNPFSPYCQIPLPNPFGAYDYPFEPAFIRKRNERERERVRCVNEGYAKLRQHLPLENKEKRISKVETLRAAIRYISHLRDVLEDLDEKTDTHNSKATTGGGVTVSKDSKNTITASVVSRSNDENATRLTRGPRKRKNARDVERDVEHDADEDFEPKFKTKRRAAYRSTRS